jgi:colanic acid/amylovoran biosynthesis protein
MTGIAKSPLTVGLMWHSIASDNLGVGALTVSQIALVESAAGQIGLPVRFIVLGWREASLPYVIASNVRGGKLRTRDLVSPNGFLSDVRKCDIVLDIGAGDSFSDIYGIKRFLKYSLAKMTVHAAKRPLIVSPQTIGPFKRGWARWLALFSLRRSTAIFTRDELSIDFLRNVGFTGTVQQASDVALRLPYTPPPARVPGGPVKIGINVSGLLMNGGYTGANMFGLASDYPALMRRLIGEFARREGCEVHLVAHVLSKHFAVEDDWQASETLAREVPGNIVLGPRFANPSEAKSYIAGLDFFMGARMHACIAAFSSGVPVVPMAYSRKFAGLFDALGYHYTVDCTKEAAETIEAKILANFENRHALKSDLDAALQLGLERLGVYEAELKRQMLALG